MKEVMSGWHYIASRPGLKGLLIYFAVANLMLGLYSALLTPLLLTISDEKILGMVMSGSGVGMILGGLIMSAWGGPKRKINGVMGFFFLSAIFIILIGLKESTWLIGISEFFMMMFMQLGNASSRSIWQIKVEPKSKGEFFP